LASSLKSKKSQEKRKKTVPAMLKEPIPSYFKKLIIAPSNTWKFGLTKIREIRAIEVGSVFFAKDVDNLLVSPASAVYRDWDNNGIPIDRVPEKERVK